MTQTLTLANQEITLFPDRTMLVHSANTLVISDVHLGKVIHFRKAGIPIPEAAGKANLLHIHAALERVKPKKVLFLGDLFHSDYNREWEDFCRQRAHFASIDFLLVHGNHDILKPEHYQQACIELVGQTYEIGDLLFTHEPWERKTALYNIAGHVHPKVVLRGKGNQSAVIPCFYFGKRKGLMPAFGAFTGGYKIKPKKGDQVFGLLSHEVARLS